MRAIAYDRYGGPDVLELKDVARPVPGDREVLVRVGAAAVTTADVAARKADSVMTRLAFGVAGPRKRVLGTEFAGDIEAVGAGVTRFRPGDRVYAATGAGFGAHADYVCLPEDGALAPKPAGLDDAEAAAVCEGGLTALPFLRDKGQIRGGQTALVNGASGAVGASAVQLAKAFGAEVIGVCSAANADLVRSLGADRVVDYAREDFTRADQAYDIVFDAVGKSSFARCKGALRENGIYLSTVPTPVLFLQMLWTARRPGRKAVVTFTGLRPPTDKAKDLVFLSELVAAGKLKPVIDRRYPLDQAVEAHRRVETGHKRGSVVVVMAEEAR